MLPQLNHLTTLALVIFSCVLLSSDGLRINRGDQDDFENPSCLNSGGISCICNHLNADCLNHNCTRCRCRPPFDTFYSSNDKHGRCVEDADLILIPDNSTKSSFLVQNVENNWCITHSGPLEDPNVDYVTAKVCDKNIPTQQWIWTQNKQLLNMDTLKCLETTQKYQSKKPFYRLYLSLQDCSTDEPRQKWKCEGNNYLKSLYRYRYGFKYMLFNRTFDPYYVLLSYNPQSISDIMWQRYQSKDILCSKASRVFSCNRFIDWSYLLVVDIHCTSSTCGGSKRIFLNQVPTKAKCSVMWKQSQFLHHNYWKQLSFTERILKISVATYGNGKFEWDFTKASSKWSGLIIKLHFECIWQYSWLETKERYRGCVMIKFKGTPMPTPTKPVTTTVTVSPTPMVSTGHTTLTDTSTLSIKTNEPISTYKSPPSITPAGTVMSPSTHHLTNQTSNKPNSEERKKNESSNVVAIVVCSVVAILVSLAILGFIFYKRRFRNSPKSSSGADNQGDSSARQSSADTRNPIYSPAENSYASPISNNDQLYQEPDAGASQECVLYESSENNTHDYATLEKDVNFSPVREETYDYAKNDDIRSAVQQMHPKSNSRQDNRNVSSDLEENKIGDADTTPVYQTLEDPYQNV